MLMTKNKSLRLFCGFLETFSLLQLKLFLRAPKAARAFPGYVFRNYMRLAKTDRWNSVSILELVPAASRLEVNLIYTDPKGLYAAFDELVYLALLTRHAQPRKIFEIGTFLGRTALLFALNSPPDCRIYTLDLPEKERPEVLPNNNPYDARLIQQCEIGVDYRGSPVEHKIQELAGNSLTFDFTPYSGMDIVFIDGCHQYAAAKADTGNALRIVKPGGLVIWHDFANYGDYHDVTRAVLDSVPAKDLYQISDSQLAVYRKPLVPLAA